MSNDVIEVRIHGRGTVAGGAPHKDASTHASCDACGQVADAVVSTGSNGAGPFLCKSCLRERLEHITLSLWTFREGDSQGLPWGKISG